MDYIIIDTGTTNTRVRYVSDEEILFEYKKNIGVKDTAITGSTKKLKECLREGIQKCLEQTHKTLENVVKIIAFGMITSDLGLVEIPHVSAPADMKKLYEHRVEKTFIDICEKPICFIPGVKNHTKDIDEMDMMRGEETEAFGILQLSKNQKTIFISPGSHTKFVWMEDGSILKCSTTLTGELLWALCKETILTHSISQNLMEEVDEEYILKGMDMAKKHGFSKTCFLVRTIDLFGSTNRNQRANFLAGAIAYYDIQSIQRSLKDQPRIVIGGSRILRELYHCVFEKGYDQKVELLSNDQVNHLSSIAAIHIVNHS